MIIQMLVSSKPGRIELLPALPEQWSEGTIEGVLARGAIEVERLEWNSDEVKVALRSKMNQTIQLELGDKIEDVVLPAGKTVSLQMKR